MESLSREAVAEKLRCCGITPTQQRVEIGHVLFERPAHLSAEQVLALVNARGAEASKATVYNTLKLFVEKGLVRELVVDPSKVFYDSNTGPHYHFYDVVSGELTDIPARSICISGLPPLPPGTESDGMDVFIRTRPKTQV